MNTTPEFNDSTETLLKRILLIYQNGGGVGPEGPAGPQGPAGTNGLDGKTILNGSGAPAAGLGVDGDFYIDTTGNLIYGPKTAGAWGAGVSIVGPTGNTGPVGPTGPTGATGADGQSSSFYDYKVKTGQTSGDPGNTYLIYNNATQTSATQINVSHIDKDGYDIDILLALIKTGDIFFIQDSSESNNYQKWQVSGTPVAQTGYFEFPVTLVTSAGTGTTGLGNNLEVLFIIATSSGGGGGGGADLQEVWLHTGI